MKLSISLPDEDVVVLDEHARGLGLRSRSTAVRDAIGFLRHRDLEEGYASAWADWDVSGERAAWEGLVNDGLP